MDGVILPIIEGLKKEIERLEKIAAHFQKSNSVHADAVLTVIQSVRQHIRMLESEMPRSGIIVANHGNL